MSKALVNHRQIADTARRMSLLSLSAAILAVIAYAGLWLDLDWARGVLGAALPGIATPSLATWQWVAGFLLGALPITLLAAALWQVRQFFELYRGGEVFPPQAGRRLRNFGGLLLVLAITGFLVRIAASVVFSWGLGEGQKRLEISISSADLFILIIAGLVMMIGRILFEANRVAEENRQFV